MKVSVIIAVYKDVEALELIIESLKNQIYKNFEVCGIFKIFIKFFERIFYLTQ